MPYTPFRNALRLVMRVPTPVTTLINRDNLPADIREPDNRHYER